MPLNEIAILGGVWLSLLYSATVMPATVWVIQLTVSRGWIAGLMAGAGLALGQVPWCLAASLLLFQFEALWQAADLALRGLAVVFLAWMAIRSAKASAIRALKLEVRSTPVTLFKASFWRSLSMPWRFPLWVVIILSVSVHLRGPGWQAAGFFTIGGLLGQIAWFSHFVLIAGLFGHRVPEDISLRSMNKLRLLATVVLGGLAVILIAPIAFPPT